MSVRHILKVFAGSRAGANTSGTHDVFSELAKVCVLYDHPIPSHPGKIIQTKFESIRYIRKSSVIHCVGIFVVVLLCGLQVLECVPKLNKQ